MEPENQFYQFYKPYLRKISHTIEMGKALIFVGINTIGKVYLAEQILSDKFRNEFFPVGKVHLVFINLKNRSGITTNQLFAYWLSETAKVLGIKVENREINNFSFYSRMNEIIVKLSADEKIAFILLDAQNSFSCDEVFFQSLIYLQVYSYGKLSYIFLSEPQILENKNPGVLRFIQRYESSYKFTFLKTWDTKTVIAEIKRQESLHHQSFKRYQSLLLKYSRGLSGILATFCYLLKVNPDIKNIRQLMKIANNNRSCQYWFYDVLSSLPRESVRILKETAWDKNNFRKYGNNIYGKYLFDLSFVKRDGSVRYPLMLPLLAKYSQTSGRNISKLKKLNNSFSVNGDKIKLTKKESAVLQILYKNKGKVTTIDALSQALWKDNPDKFSLWAISQIIRRLRKKLSFYFINPQTIRSVRGEGYELKI